MREHEMRMRAFRFLKARMRHMLMPATVGIGLAVGGCSDPRSLYMGPMPSDAGTDAVVANHDIAADGRDGLVDFLPPDLAQPDLDAQLLADLSPDKSPADSAIPLDGATVADAVSEAGYTDSVPDLGGMKYIAPFLDAAPADAPVDSAIAKYVAPMPDASVGDMPAMRYLAQMPDAGLAGTPLYMAQPPRET